MTSLKVRGRARIFSQRTVSRRYLEARVVYTGAPSSAPLPSPGQFFMLQPRSPDLHVTRRPFAYSAADESGFSFIYELRGDVTQEIAGMSAEEEIDWIGPLGSRFPSVPGNRRPVLFAGGIGVGPILFLAHHFTADGHRPLIVFGARSADLVPELTWPAQADLRICTDDGSRGIQGNVLAAMTQDEAAGAAFYACGPTPMMKAVHQLACDAELPCWVSMEEMMACGVGACQGCAVETVPSGTGPPGPVYRRACVEGPIFSSADLVWDRIS